MAYEVVIDGERIFIDEQDGALVLRSSCCPEHLRENLQKMFYGVEVVSDGEVIYIVPTERSGVREEYKPFFKQYLDSNLVEHNQLPLIVLALGVGIVVLCQVYPDAPICKAISGYTWDVLMPLLTFGLGAVIGYYLLG